MIVAEFRCVHHTHTQTHTHTNTHTNTHTHTQTHTHTHTQSQAQGEQLHGKYHFSQIVCVRMSNSCLPAAVPNLLLIQYLIYHTHLRMDTLHTLHTLAYHTNHRGQLATWQMAQDWCGQKFNGPIGSREQQQIQQQQQRQQQIQQQQQVTILLRVCCLSPAE